MITIKLPFICEYEKRSVKSIIVSGEGLEEKMEFNTTQNISVSAVFMFKRPADRVTDNTMFCNEGPSFYELSMLIDRYLESVIPSSRQVSNINVSKYYTDKEDEQVMVLAIEEIKEENVIKQGENK